MSHRYQILCTLPILLHYLLFTAEKPLSTVQVLCYVPQGSVLGPSMFILYAAELAALASKFGVKLYAFAYDNQLHVHCDISDIISSVVALEECVTAIGRSMSANMLKLDAEKTELMCAGIRYSVANLLCDHDLTLTLGADTVKTTDVIRVLGVLFTPDLALENQVTSVSAKCFFQLRHLRRMRRSLDRDSAATCPCVCD